MADFDLGPIIETTRVVTEQHGPRPAGSPDECFYCRAPVGGLHEDTCVMYEREIAIEVTVRYKVRVPQHWTEEDIMFHRNEGTWCAGNIIEELEERFGDDADVCMCAYTDVKVIPWKEHIDFWSNDG